MGGLRGRNSGHKTEGQALVRLHQHGLPRVHHMGSGGEIAHRPVVAELDPENLTHAPVLWVALGRLGRATS